MTRGDEGDRLEGEARPRFSARRFRGGVPNHRRQPSARTERARVDPRSRVRDDARRARHLEPRVTIRETRVWCGVRASLRARGDQRATRHPGTSAESPRPRRDLTCSGTNDKFWNSAGRASAVSVALANDGGGGVVGPRVVVVRPRGRGPRCDSPRGEGSSLGRARSRSRRVPGA